jgi:hypothetical protein
MYKTTQHLQGSRSKKHTSSQVPVVISEFYSPRLNNNGVGELKTSLDPDEIPLGNN